MESQAIEQVASVIETDHDHTDEAFIAGLVVTDRLQEEVPFYGDLLKNGGELIDLVD